MRIEPPTRNEIEDIIDDHAYWWRDNIYTQEFKTSDFETIGQGYDFLADEFRKYLLEKFEIEVDFVALNPHEPAKFDLIILDCKPENLLLIKLTTNA